MDKNGYCSETIGLIEKSVFLYARLYCIVFIAIAHIGSQWYVRFIFWKSNNYKYGNRITIVSQLDRCLKFKSIWGDKNDCALYKGTPRSAIDLRLYSVVALNLKGNYKQNTSCSHMKEC